MIDTLSPGHRMKHCCDHMKNALVFSCPDHEDPFACPDCVMVYDERFDEYGLAIHDGGTSSLAIAFCPWCGTRLPESKRDLWFDALARLGFDDPGEQEIPEAYRSDAWYSAGHRD